MKSTFAVTFFQGDLVWFNALASTTALAAAAAANSVVPNSSLSHQQNGEESSGSASLASDTLLIPGEVIEYHPKGNVLILKSSGSAGAGKDDQQQHTIENNPQNVRKRIGELRAGPGQVGFPDMICMGDLSEPALIWNVRERYAGGEIYVSAG